MTHGARVVALVAQPLADRLGGVAVDVAGDRASALLAELARDRGADRATGSRDVRNLPIEQHLRARLPLWHAPHTRRSGTTTRSASDLLFVDLHLVHEVTSPQAFEGLRLAGRTVRRPDRTIATADHNVPTWDFSRADRGRHRAPAARGARAQRARSSASRTTAWGHRRQGIVHVIGPELGITQPGMTIVCGDSHTSTHGAFGALAFGIGTSEVEHVLATQTLPQKRAHTMRVTFTGAARPRRRREGPDPRPDRARRRSAGATTTSSSTAARRSGRSRWRAA